MNRRGRRLIAAIAGVVALLFAGRWAAGLLADRWWAAQISPAAVDFLTDWHILRLTLDLAGFLLASAWFIGHLLVVYRAVGSVQVRRNVANLEFREALTPGVLLAVAVGAGALLGLLVGTGGAERWQQVALAWQGVSYGVADPLLQQRRRPVRGPAAGLAAGARIRAAARRARARHRLRTLRARRRGALARGPARDQRPRARPPRLAAHRRSRSRWCGATCSSRTSWSRASGRPVDLAAWSATTLVSPLLVGVALATAGLSAAWALRPRHALAAAGWIVLSLASVVGHWMVPPAIEGKGEPAAARPG